MKLCQRGHVMPKSRVSHITALATPLTCIHICTSDIRFNHASFLFRVPFSCPCLFCPRLGGYGRKFFFHFQASSFHGCCCCHLTPQFNLLVNAIPTAWTPHVLAGTIPARSNFWTSPSYNSSEKPCSPEWIQNHCQPSSLLLPCCIDSTRFLRRHTKQTSCSFLPFTLSNWQFETLFLRFLFKNCPSPSSPSPPLLLFFPIQSAMMSSTKTFNCNGGYNVCDLTRCILQHNTWKPLWPWWSGAAPSQIVRTELASGAGSTRKAPTLFSFGKLRCVAQAHTTGGLTRSKAFAKYSTKPLHPNLLPLLCILIYPFSAEHTLSNEILHFNHQWHPTQHDTSAAISPLLVLSKLPTNDLTSASAQSVSHFVIFFGIKKNIVVHACCGHLPICSTFSKNSTISRSVSLVKSKEIFGCHPWHPTPIFALYNLDTSSSSHSFNLGSASSNFFNSLFIQGVSSRFCTSSLHCQCFATTFQQPYVLLLFFQNQCSSTPCCGFRDIGQKTGTVFRTLHHLPYLLLTQFFHLLFLIHLLPPSKNTIFAWCLPILHEAKLSRSPPRKPQLPTIDSRDLIFFDITFIALILCCLFLFFHT